MSLFGPSIPKGITKKELPYLRGRLLAGKGGEKLSRTQVDHIMELLEMNLDADSHGERSAGIEQVDANEAARVEAQIANNRGISYSDAQEAYVKRIFTEFLQNNKIPSIF